MFFGVGYGASSIEAIAQRARISKRTFYHRFRDKADVFGAVVHDVVTRLRGPDAVDAEGVAALFAGPDLEVVLLRLARRLLQAGLSPQAVALQRLVVSEALRFPELANVVLEEGSRQIAVGTLAAVLDRERQSGRISLDEPVFAAEQFLQMVMAYPLRRAMGLGLPMTEAELDAWGRSSVRLFLGGCRGWGDSRSVPKPI